MVLFASWLEGNNVVEKVLLYKNYPRVIFD